MNQKTKVLLGSFIALLVVVLAVKWWPRGNAQHELRIPGWSEGKKVDKADEEAPYDRIEVEMGSSKVTLERGPDKKWTMTPPKGARADSYKVRQVLEAFREGIVSVIASQAGQDLAAFGLDDATRVKLVLSKGGAEAVAIEIGAVQKPQDGGFGEGDTFVRIPGQDRVYRLIQKDLRRPFEDGIRGLRDRKVFDFDADAVKALAVSNPKAPDPVDRAFSLQSEEKTTEGKEDKEAKKEQVWRFAEPSHLKAGDVRYFVSTITGLYAQEYVDELPKDVAIGDDAYSVDLTLKDGKKVKLALSENQGDSAYVRIEGTAGFAKVSKFTADQIRKKVADLRDKTIFGVKREDIRGVQVVDKGKRLAFQREGNGYLATEPASLPLSRSAVEQMLADIETLKADNILSPAEVSSTDTGLENPDVTVTVWLKDGGMRVLKVGKEKEKGTFYVQMPGSAEVGTMAQWMLARVRKGPSDLRNKKVFDFAEGDMTTIELVHKDETLRLVREGSEGKWKATSPKEEAGLKAETVNTLVNALAGLTVKDFAQDKTPATVGLLGQNQELLVAVTTKDGARHVVRVSSEKKDGDPYAVSPTEKDFRGMVFTLNQYQVRNFQKRLKELL